MEHREDSKRKQCAVEWGCEKPQKRDKKVLNVLVLNDVKWVGDAALAVILVEHDSVSNNDGAVDLAVPELRNTRILEDAN